MTLSLRAGLGTPGRSGRSISASLNYTPNQIVVKTVKTDRLGVNLCQDADGYRPGIGDHETPPVEHHELPLMAISGHFTTP